MLAPLNRLWTRFGLLLSRVTNPIVKCSSWYYSIEFWSFLRSRKKFWLLPIIIVLLIFGGLLILAQGSAGAPFVYTIF